MSRFLVFLGSVRTDGPPAPQRLGLRVSRAIARNLHGEGEIIDPLDLDLGPTFRPYFSYGKGRAPTGLEALASRIDRAEGYVCVTPEYNHSFSPVLADLLNHFGSSQFGFKPSAIVTYSAGQWGGTRAAVALRPFLSELGCLPVSAMVHVPKAQDALGADGHWTADEERWDGYVGRSLDQLRWWADAAAAQRAEIGTPTKPFRKAPEERNAPRTG